MRAVNIAAALLCFAILGISQVPNDKRVPKQNGALDTAPKSNTEKEQRGPTNPTQTIAIYDQPSRADCNSANNRSEDAIGVERQLARFTGYLVIVGLLQFVILAVQAVLFFQQRNIMGQHKVSLEQLAGAATDNAAAASKNAEFSRLNAEATKENAIAAKTNADIAEQTANALMRRERAWVLIEREEATTQDRIQQPYLPTAAQMMADQRMPYCIFFFRNEGRTAAKILTSKAELQISESPTVLPDPNIYDTTVTLTFPDLLPPSKSSADEARFRALSGEQELIAVRAGLKFLWLCGVIRYTDIFEQGTASEHETRFCYLWETRMNTPQPFWLPAGLRDYNKAT